MADKKYIVAKGRIVSNSKDGKDYREGEEVDLSHLDPEALAAVVESGAVVEKTAEKKKEGKNE